jgi:hypothetical protein
LSHDQKNTLFFLARLGRYGPPWTGGSCIDIIFGKPIKKRWNHGSAAVFIQLRTCVVMRGGRLPFGFRGVAPGVQVVHPDSNLFALHSSFQYLDVRTSSSRTQQRRGARNEYVIRHSILSSSLIKLPCYYRWPPSRSSASAE